MKKILIALCLLGAAVLPASAQLNVSGVGGEDGYSVIRASFDAPFMLLPGMGIQAKYAMATADDISTMTRLGVGLTSKVPFLDIVNVGVEGGLQLKANGYSNYYYDLHGDVELNELLFRLVPVDELRLGLGMRQTMHSFYDPDFDTNQSDIYGFLYQRTGGFDLALNYTKAVNYTHEDQLAAHRNPWMDVPFFVAAYNGFLDYSAGVTAGYTYSMLRPYAAYSIIKTKGERETDDLRLGITAKIATIDVNAAVEWYNLSERAAGERERFFTISAGVSLL